VLARSRREVGKAKGRVPPGGRPTCRWAKTLDSLRQGAVPGRSRRRSSRRPAAHQEAPNPRPGRRAGLATSDCLCRGGFKDVDPPRPRRESSSLGCRPPRSRRFQGRRATPIFSGDRPPDGVVIQCSVVAGEVWNDARILFVVDDTRRLRRPHVRRDARSASRGSGRPLPPRRRPGGVRAVAWVSHRRDRALDACRSVSNWPTPPGGRCATGRRLGQDSFSARGAGRGRAREAGPVGGQTGHVCSSRQGLSSRGRAKVFTRGPSGPAREGRDNTEIIARQVCPANGVAAGSCVLAGGNCLKNSLGKGKLRQSKRPG